MNSTGSGSSLFSPQALRQMWAWLAGIAVVAVCWLAGGCASVAQQGFAVADNRLSVQNVGQSMPMRWAAGRFGERIEPHLALMLPVRIEGVPQEVLMQLDVGAPSSSIRSNALAAMQSQFGAFAGQGGGDAPRLRDVKFSVGPTQITASEMRVFVERGSATVAWGKPEAPPSVGTLGADFVDGRFVVLDFPKMTLTLHDRLPTDLASRAQWTPLRYVQRRFFIEAKVNGEPRTIIYDSGSSAFSLLTSKGDWEKLRKEGAAVEQFPVKSWNDTLNVTHTATDAVIEIGNVKLPLGSVAYVDDVGVGVQMMMHLMGVGGMSGNKLFIRHTIVFDTQGQRFGILPE